MAKKFLQRALEVSKEVVGRDHHYVAALVGQVCSLESENKRQEGKHIGIKYNGLQSGPLKPIQPIYNQCSIEGKKAFRQIFTIYAFLKESTV